MSITVRLDKAVTINLTGGVLLEDFAMLDGWKIWDGAWGGKASFQSADSVPPGATGAIQGHFPGIIYKELTEAQTRDCATWNSQAGLSFWVKGDGSENYGCLAIGPANPHSWQQGWAQSTAYAFYFPLKETGWHQVTAGWHEFVAEESQPEIGALGGLLPAQIRVIRLGNRWQWKHHPHEPSPGRDYAIADIRFATTVAPRKPVPPLPGFEGVLAKLRRKEPVSIRILGDSISVGHFEGCDGVECYGDRLGRMLRSMFGYEAITIDNRAVCAGRISDARGWVPRDFAGTAPDLVMMKYGTNDSVSHKPQEFARMLRDYLDRVAVATGGKSAVLLLTPIPGALERYDSAAPVADIIREAAAQRGLPCCDLHSAFKALGAERVGAMMDSANVHPNAEGQELIARTIADALNSQPSTLNPSL
jgi:lysophospholipase L1-like esterase